MAMDTEHLRDITESKALADALRNSEHRYRKFIETASEGILVAQGNKLKFANPVVTELTGYTEDELLSIPVQEFIHPDYRELMKNNHMKRILGEPVDQRYEIQIVKKDGSFRWIEISGAKIDWEAQPATLNFVTDISERKYVETEREELNTLFNITSDLMCIANITGNFIKVNPSCTNTLGYTTEELVSRPFMDFVHPDDKEKTLAVVEEHLKVGIPVFRFENRYRCKDGTYKWLSWTSNPFPEKGITYAVARDITERKNADEALRQSEERFRNLLQDIPTVAVQGYGPDGTTQYWNKASERLYGFSAEEAIGRNLLDLIIPPEARSDVEQAIRVLKPCNRQTSRA
jgi:two-component system cell cycle sensor histidine kinase/response regulator CckA